MAILIHKNTRVITQGISGKSGRFHTEQCLVYGSRFVGGVTPGRGGETILDLPVFDTVREAKKKDRGGCNGEFGARSLGSSAAV